MRYSSCARARFYHRFLVVWVTKYRYKVLEGAMHDRIREIIIQSCTEMGVHIVKGVLARDHVMEPLIYRVGCTDFGTIRLCLCRRGAVLRS